MAHYILQVILFQLVFLLVYEFLLKKETFFLANRWYLLLTPVFSLLLPLLKIEALAGLFPEESTAVWSNILLPEVFLGGTAQNVQNLPEVIINQQQYFQINWWLMVYFGGALLSILLFFKKYQSLNRLFSFSRISEEKEFRIIEVPNSKIACTFYKTIFLGDRLSEEEKQQILSHELVHVRQKHSLDLVFFELLKIIFWFNPLVYIFQHRIAVLHEFIADASVVKTTKKRNYYEQLLNTAFNTRNISFINQFFNHSLIKKRILMLQKSRSKSIAKFKFLVIVPLLLIMLTYVACSQDKASDELQTQNLENENLTIQVENLSDFTPGEKEELSEVMKVMNSTSDYKEVRMTDGKKTIIYSVNTPDGTPSITVENNGEKEPYIRGKEVAMDKDQKSSEVPFAVIDEVPVFPGCEDLESLELRKHCMSSGITDFVSSNFNVKEMRQYAEQGINRVIVQFKIDATGQVVNAKARASSPELEAEAIRVVNALPKMEPGKQRGKEVGVMYSLPIVFQGGE
ncbi:M56 family metallopeptidase [Salegentibacter sediminis]|uniref:M56 family metallopeptidase n=1 Tax=Salegentibacter sediminis TaxID=1930251 RepID=UPI0009BFD32C|nr:M56 family metallopeptidase [Salegentibacter sediminis]